MNPILEHDDLKKSGRAVVISSLLIILVAECTTTFEDVNFLGIRANLTSSDLNAVLWVVCTYYFLMYLYHVVSINPVYEMDLLLARKSKNIESRLLTVEELTDGEMAEARRRFDALRRDNETQSKDRNRRIQEARGPINLISKRRNLSKKRAERYYSFVFVAEATQFLLVQVIIPLVFFIFALTPLSAYAGDKMCSGGLT